VKEFRLQGISTIDAANEFMPSFYERKIYMLADNTENRRLIGKYIDVLQFPDGHVEIRAGGQSLPYSTYDRVGVTIRELW
jgi:hypothetical protein